MLAMWIHFADYFTVKRQRCNQGQTETMTEKVRPHAHNTEWMDGRMGGWNYRHGDGD